MRDAVVVQNVSKKFLRYHTNKPITFQETLLNGLRRMKPVEQFWALRDVSFSVAPGRMVGLIGRNGSGKSTLLRLIGGIGRPNQGSVKVNGRIRALLDLGVGLRHDLTGRENVFISGVISGLTHREVQKRFDAIVEFAELEAFIDNPLRTYSAGMQMRLGFAIAVHTSPEILLIDEILAVGDLAFQRKCLEKISQFKAEGCTIILVSHNEEQIQRLCDEVIYLRKGQLIAQGDAAVLVGQYIADAQQATRERTPSLSFSHFAVNGTELRVNENRFGSLEMQITGVRLLNAVGQPIRELIRDEPLRVEIEYDAPQPIPSPIFGISIHCEDQLTCYETSTVEAQQTLPTLQGQGKVTLHLDRLDLNSGQYSISVGVYQANWDYAYDYHWHVYPLLIRRSGFGKGILSTPNHWEIEQVSPGLRRR